ncbi:MAG: DUF4058 family protein [Gemmataceae bacterium]
MPIHDWTRVYDGAFHDQHNTWITFLKVALNAGLLPRGFYAQSAQVSRPMEPDVLTLELPAVNGHGASTGPGGGAVATLAPPQTAYTFLAEAAWFTTRQREIEIRHTDGHRIVALIEIVSRGNKASAYPFETFVTKITAALFRGVHVLMIDLHAPTPRDPNGIHSAIWTAIGEEEFQPPPGRPLTLASYDAGPVKAAHVEPVAVGDVMRPMPLFLEPGAHILVPLEETYMQAYAATPDFYRAILERPG